ncbi:inositol monophosphatase family protein [Longilinea arvoryzae]|nr:inositol monophosphatase family protein [Longilinea arvoryzae]
MQQPTLFDLIDLARASGEILRAGYGQDHQVHYKGLIDLVTEVDRNSENMLLERIRARFPQDAIITEESGRFEGETGCSWIIDPLDGTVNFAHGVPIFAVSIAYSVNREVRMGVVYDPLRDECFSAERGKGAWLNGLPISPSVETNLQKALLVTGFSYDPAIRDRNLPYFVQLVKKAQAVRRMGSAALDLSYVACGRLDGYWEMQLKSWDIAAAGLIAQESGALVTDMDGNPDFMRPPYGAVAANAALHAALLAELKNVEDNE